METGNPCYSEVMISKWPVKSDMKDYTKLEKYKNDTPLDAKFHYMQDLLSKVCCESGCTPDCRACAFAELMDDPRAKCCGWLAAAHVDRAIEVLEHMLGIPYTPEYDSPWAIDAIAVFNGITGAMDLAQEESAELVQAISKRRRYPTADSLDKIIEELADVSILIDELCALIPRGRDRLARRRDEKIKRTLDRCGIVCPWTPLESQVWATALDYIEDN